MEKKIKVLLVDDEIDFTQAMAFWLQSKGYSVMSAPDGESAIRLIKESAPDIVFLDLNMPVMDGPQTLKRIREFNQDLPVIIISAHLDEPRTEEMSSYGISGVFCKSEDLSKGLILLEAALRTHKQLKK